MLKERITVALVGMGGYGINYVNAILDCSEDCGIECVGMVDVRPENCNRYEELVAKNIPLYKNLEELYRNHIPRLLFIATPIQFHFAQICFALENGSHVLCEKPAAATADQVKRIVQLSREKDRFVAIGFQRCYTSAVLSAKSDILSGKYGKPLEFKTIYLQQRPISYYQRAWAGKIKAGDDYIYDSVANNACAHYLHHMLFMAGDQWNTAMLPEKIEAECYRVNEIENFDMITLKMVCESGLKMYFAATQSSEDVYGPYCCCEFEGGRIILGEDGELKGQLNSGESIYYGDLTGSTVEKISCAVATVGGENMISCDANTALPHSTIIQYIQDNVKIRDLQDRAEIVNVAEADKPPVYMKQIPGIKDIMIDCYRENSMLSTKL